MVIVAPNSKANAYLNKRYYTSERLSGVLFSRTSNRISEKTSDVKIASSDKNLLNDTYQRRKSVKEEIFEDFLHFGSKRTSKNMVLSPTVSRKSIRSVSCVVGKVSSRNNNSSPPTLLTSVENSDLSEETSTKKPVLSGTLCKALGSWNGDSRDSTTKSEETKFFDNGVLRRSPSSDEQDYDELDHEYGYNGRISAAESCGMSGLFEEMNSEQDSNEQQDSTSLFGFNVDVRLFSSAIVICFLLTLVYLV